MTISTLSGQSETHPVVLDPATLRRNMVSVAMSEWQRWNTGGRRTERDPRMRAALAAYWRQGAGISVRESDLASATFQAAWPWSAAFISWVMRRAGAGTAFRYSAAHANYIVAARQNRIANNDNPIKAYRVTELRPQVGDIVCRNRAGSRVTYETVASGHKTHCDIVVAVEPGRITVVGGNKNDSVSTEQVPLTAAGLLAPPSYFAILRIGPVGNAPAPTPGPTPSNFPLVPPRRPAGGITILERETSPIGVTLYPRIDLAITGRGKQSIVAEPRTGVFLPAHFNPSLSADLVVYLHGHKTANPGLGIHQLWNARLRPQFALREQLVRSGANAILAAPTLGPLSEFGRLGVAGGFDDWLSQTLAAIGSLGPAWSSLTPRRIFLACHSGGGTPMRIIASAANRVSSAIRQCWGFDCMYNVGDDVAWDGWARGDSQRHVYVYYLPGTLTERLSRALAGRRAPNVTVVASRARDHEWVPLTHFAERLAATRT